MHASTPPLSYFTGRMPFLPPNQQCHKALKASTYKYVHTLLHTNLYSAKNRENESEALTLLVPVADIANAGNILNQSSSLYIHFGICHNDKPQINCQ